MFVPIFEKMVVSQQHYLPAGDSHQHDERVVVVITVNLQEVLPFHGGRVVVVGVWLVVVVVVK